MTMAAGLIQAQPLVLTELPTGSLGTWANLLIEDGPPLSLEQAQARQHGGLFHKDNRTVLTYGIGSRPRWIHLEIFNPTTDSLPFRLVTGTTWTDRLKLFVVHDNQVTSSWQTGDDHPKAHGLTPGIGFTFTASFAPGRSDLYLRVESIDPLVLPIELMTEEQALSSERLVHYSYGFIYGFLIALLAYNGMLFIGLRKRSHLYYSLYLVSLILLNVAYTGHGSAWLWPDYPLLQRYMILFLMVLYGCCGLLFASRFLALAEHAPRVLRLVRLSAVSGLSLIALCIMAGSQLGAALVAFSFISLFTLGMVLLGILTIRHGRMAGRYFLVATLFGMVGAASTTLAVWGWLPFNSLTYHGLEYGAIIEATLLALALAHHYNEMTAKLSRITLSRDVLSTEVAERKQAEKMLRKSEESLKESQSIAGLGSYVLDIPTGRWKSSDVLDQLLGIDEAYERSLQGWVALTLPDDRSMIEDYFSNEDIGPDKELDKEYRILRHNDHTERWVHGLGKLEFDAQGNPVKMHGTIQDITERKQGETELRIAATAFESQEGMVITDANSVILRVNRAFTEITGYTAEDAVGQTPRLLKSGRHNEAFYTEMWSSIKRTGSWQGEIWDRRKNGEIYPKWLTITAVKSDDGTITHYVGAHTDISSRKVAEDVIKRMAFYDPLTQLPNRRLLNDRLSQAMAASTRSGHYGALMFLDLDNFKQLNDTHGHRAGDLLLIEAANRLNHCVREMDTVARFGGDEFVVVLSDLTADKAESASQVKIVAEKIRITLSEPYLLNISHDGKADTMIEHHCTASIGVVMFIDHAGSQDDILKWADVAMYQAKEAGRNLIRFYNSTASKST
ncbi:MAG: diguanylate cyclase [Gammaproteobacteria bacterium]|nr:diguanylate cyclase [Gammaproteobacteria bacterium]MBU1979649.1 diguanylate cyclase [Gammaproteobacteria bacterium]